LSLGAIDVVKRIHVNRVPRAFAVLFVACLNCRAQISNPPVQEPQKPLTVEQRVSRGDDYAFIEAADANRRDLIPVLEKFSGDGTARKALAKLGVKKYLDEFVTDLASTNSPLLKFWEETYRGPGEPTVAAEREAELTAKGKALDALVYIGNKSTVKYIAAELYNTNCPNRAGSDNLLESRTPIAWLAARALSQMNLQDAPRPSAEGDPEWLNYIEAWKKWWEQNKDKYP
jgi:hypothetical protein